jgi:hypothetical protein
MPAIRFQWQHSLRSIAPWIGATAALLVALVLMVQFIDTLHLSIARGEALRATLAATATATPSDAIQFAGTGQRPQR